MKLHKVLLSLTALLVVNLYCYTAFGFVPTIDPRNNKLLSSDEQASLSNPSTHGDFRPRLSGKLGNVQLKYDGQQFNWMGRVSSQGMVQAWGNPIMSFQNQETVIDMDTAIRKFIQQNLDAFQVDNSELRLDRQRTKFSGPYRYMTYARYRRTGDADVVPVEGAFITFRFKGGNLIAITNFSFGKVSPAEPPSLSAQDAVETVSQDSGFENIDKFTKKVSKELQPYYLPNGQINFRFIYKVTLRKARSGGLWEYSVGASDGRIVRLMNLLHTGHVGAEVYPRLPGQGLNVASLPEANVKSGGHAERTDLEGNFSSDASGAIAELSGLRAIVKQAGKNLPSQQAKGDEILFSARENLSENMAYFYVNKVNQFVRNFVASAPVETMKGKTDFLNSPMIVNTKMNSPSMKGCNAWFDPDIKTLNFLDAAEVCDASGQCMSCEASSQFSDIIFHEWGHGLDDALGGIQDDAFSEGIGDFTAALMTGDSKIGPGFIKGRDGKPIRDINVVKVYPRDRNKDPHQESLIVSGAWFETLQMMKKIYGEEDGRMKTANLFFKHLVATDSYSDSYLGALAIDDDNGNLGDCTPNMCVLNIAFARRGIAEADPRCFSNVHQAQGTLQACAPSTIHPPQD